VTHAEPEPALLDSPQSRSLFYRKVCGLPTVVDPATGAITMRAGAEGAVMMPIQLATRVKLELDRAINSPYPIIGHPKAGMWSFLVRTDAEPVGPTVAAQFRRARVIVIRDGDIVLPSPAPDQWIARTWVAPTATPFRPSAKTVLRSVRRCLASAEPRPDLPHP